MSFSGFMTRALPAQSLKRLVGVGGVLLAASCASTGPAPSGIEGQARQSAPATVAGAPTPPPLVTPDGVTPPFMANRQVVRVGLLLPFSSLPDEARALYQAAELGVFDFGGATTLLIPRESGATPADAATNARLLLRDGADVILGPVQREAVQGAATAAREKNVPVIGFSSDREVAGDGVYILSVPLEEDVRRIVSYALSKGMRNIALLAPENDYGRRVESALRAELASRGGSVVAVERYPRNEAAAGGAARRMAQMIRGSNTNAILIADGGSTLRATGPALLAGGVDLKRVQLLGTGAWAGPDVLREPTLAGGLYPAPDPAVRGAFEARYKEVYGRAPSTFASRGYDAVMIASKLGQSSRSGQITRSGIERPDGFMGADGILRFRDDGSIERGLAILKVGQGVVETAEPAPRSLRGS